MGKGEVVSEIEVPVWIVGGSLVGLSAGMLLAQLAIRSLVVERHPGTAIHPRAAHATQRTMEIFRSAGVEQAIRQRSAEQFVQDGGIVAVETLLGGVTRQFIADLNAGIRDVSPCERVCASLGSLPVTSSQKWSVKLMCPISSPARSRPRTQIASSLEVEIAVL